MLFLINGVRSLRSIRFNLTDTSETLLNDFFPLSIRVLKITNSKQFNI